MRDFLMRNRAAPTRAALAPLPADFVCALNLAAGVSERVPVPATPVAAQYVNISATGDVYVAFGGEAVVATVPGDVTDGTASALNPSTRQIPDGVTHIAIICEEEARATLEFWA